MMRSITKFAYSTFLRSSIILSAFVVFLISSYLYGPEGRGVISFVGSFYFAVSLLLTFGLARVAYQNITGKKERVGKTLSAALTFMYLTSLFFFAVVWILSASLDFGFLPGSVKPQHFVFLYGWFF
ncbi:MAG: hypothetical protein KUL82_10565, partial [Bdellovibrio sp.]|nr:hypothetical protein [Bdellovibrio sp.]